MTPSERAAVIRVLIDEKRKVHTAREVLARDLESLTSRHAANPGLVSDWQITQVSRQIDAAQAVESHLGRMLLAYPSSDRGSAVAS